MKKAKPSRKSAAEVRPWFPKLADQLHLCRLSRAAMARMLSSHVAIEHLGAWPFFQLMDDLYPVRNSREKMIQVLEQHLGDSPLPPRAVPPAPLEDKLPSFERLVHEAMKQEGSRSQLLRMLTDWAGDYGLLPDRTPEELAQALRDAGYENHGLTELLARYAEALAKSETVSSEASAGGIALLLFAQQERLALRIEEAANTLYRVHKEQQKPQE